MTVSAIIPSSPKRENKVCPAPLVPLRVQHIPPSSPLSFAPALVHALVPATTQHPSDPMSSTLGSSPYPLPRHLHKDSLSSDNPPSSYAKSSVRSQNRPVSSTTTATHSTITPLPSDSLRNRMYRGRHPYPFHPQSTDTHTPLPDHDQSTDTIDYDNDDLHFPRSETPSSSRRKLILHSLFGISLTRRSSSTSAPQQPSSTSHRKPSTSTSASASASEPRTKPSRTRSFRLTSRPSTPKSVDDSSTSKSPYFIPIPSSPLPLSASPRRRSFGLGGSQRSTPKSSTGHLPLPHVQSPQSGRSHGRRHSVGSERPPHDSAVALPEEPSHPTLHKGAHLLPDGGGRNKGKEREKFFPDSDGPLPDFRPSIDFPSQSLPEVPSPISRNYNPSQSAGHPACSHLPTVDSASSEENEQSSLLAPHCSPMIPRIIHTPPTPQRPGGEINSLSRPSTTPLEVVPGKVESAKGKTVTIAHREQVLVSSSQSHADVQHPPSSKRRFTPRFLNGKDLPGTKDRNGQKSSKRPATGSSDGPSHKTPGSNPVRNMTNHRSKLGSFDFERPVSALNKSSSTVDRQGIHVPKGDSSKPGVPSLERTISDDSARGDKSRLIAHRPGQAELPMLSQSKPDHTGDTSVVSFSSVSVQTKSTGKGTGSNTPVGQSSSWGRASGRRMLRTSHGTFAFEHTASVPSSPNPQSFNLPSEPNRKDLPGQMSGLPQSQPTSPLRNIFDARTKHARGQSYNTSDHVESGYIKSGEHKSKGKGRSLDLGLGLSWAPSRVREEVLMPGFILAREKAKLEKNRANGSDVTKVFESLLSESRFQTFKKYVHRFDAHVIPLEGPSGLLVRVEKLLTESGVSERERNKLMAEFTIFVESHSG
ncbi:hypothetical protein J3R82DRAFT_4208 [Butyriboletus roseoflavus]|nr:hypothetical protein J3R82DRAFT_4208 [Butyriboletus roseoflavus]